LLALAALVGVFSSAPVSPALGANDAIGPQAAMVAKVEDPPAQDQLAPDLWIDDVELARMMRAGQVVVVDVREAPAYDRAHLLGAMSVPLSAVVAHADELRASGKLVVTYCGGPIGEKGGRAALLLRQRGLTRVRALSGGFAAWVARGNVVEVQPS
jgi:rhodanese-related sulfurtransferase